MANQGSPVVLNYQEAIKTLNTLQSNAQVLQESASDGGRSASRSIPNMRNFLTRTGVTDDDVDSLNVIHVSGTKGKGSTCAYCESILRHHGYKTGFCSSPHLVETRERIRVNGSPLDMEKFTQYFWEVYNRLVETKGENEGIMPGYFAFMVVMTLRVFLEEKVDVAIMEVGIGGEYDSTNVIQHPIVCGVTSLGFDHMRILGNTIEEIAWNKAGIFKPGVQAFTVPQCPEAMTVLMQRAAERGCPLSQCPDLSCYEPEPKLGIQGTVQKMNASIALQLCQTWISNHNGQQVSRRVQGEADISPPTADPVTLTPAYIQGLERCNWPGRNQKVSTPGISFYLDGAHTKESVQQCVEWFWNESLKEAVELGPPIFKVLIFNSTGDRDPDLLLNPIKICGFGAALFCPNDSYESAENADQTNFAVTREKQTQTCDTNMEAWTRLTHSEATESHIFPSVSACFDWARSVRSRGAGGGEKQKHIQVLVVGSVLLVGAALRVLRDQGHTVL